MVKSRNSENYRQNVRNELERHIRSRSEEAEEVIEEINEWFDNEMAEIERIYRSGR